MRSPPQVTHYLSASKRWSKHGRREIDDTRQCWGQTDTHLYLPSIHICDPLPILLLENVEIPERVVTFVSQDAQIVLGLAESCTGPMLVSAQLEMTLSEGLRREPAIWTYGGDGHLGELFEGFCDGNGGIGHEIVAGQAGSGRGCV